MPNSDLIPHAGGEVARDRYDEREMVDTLKQTVAKGATDAQFKMFIEVCRHTGLNPFLKEIWFVPAVGVMAGRDGYLRVANENPQFDGMETRVDRDEKNVPIKATCTVWRKDRNHPIVCEAYYSEYKKSSGVWSQYPSAMISKVAEVLALKRSFSINGVVTEEEIGTGEPRGSIEAAQAVAQAKVTGAMPLNAEPTTPTPAPPAPSAPVTVLDATLATFASKKAISDAFSALNKEWRKYESQEAWDTTLEQFEIDVKGENYRSVGNAKKCFTALWKATEKMMAEAKEVQQ